VERVRLLTQDGGYVCSGMIPKFDMPPSVLTWGTRIFTYEQTDDEQVHVYTEAFTFALTEVTKE
jgi:hypothetical protein